MVRAIRRKKFQRPKGQPEHDEGDPEGYKSLGVPDEIPKDSIDEFHEKKIEKLLASGIHLHSDEEELDDEEEVMALDASETEDDDGDDDDDDENEEEDEEDEGTDMESDLEGKVEERLPDELAWGTKKKSFYDSDYMTTKGKSQEELEAEEEEEEEEAKKIQKRMAEQLSEDDYDLNFLQEFAKEDQTEVTVVDKKIVKDLKQMSHKEKMKLLKKESPEFLELIQDLKEKLTELKEQLFPLLQMVKDGRIPPGKGADYLKTKQQLYLNYCTNISFYVGLKAKRIPAHNHPVIERMLTYRNLINELSSVDARLEPQYKKLLAAWEEGGIVSKPVTKKEGAAVRKDKVSGKAVAKTTVDSDADLDEEAALRYYREVEGRMKLKKESKQRKEENEGVNEEDELDPQGKRSITYQMAKNKGLTPKRKKIDRNPRVKHREKYRRANIRRKGQVREVRREETRYSGELSGIRAGVKKSIKLK
ncbi:something about silencing protein 10 [Stigmatopora argus]